MSYVDTMASENTDGEIQLVSYIRNSHRPVSSRNVNSCLRFLYVVGGPEFPANGADLPWATERDFVVGELAREQGARVPSRLVASAKSWLCHAGIDRSAPVLPFEAPEEVRRISPLDAATRYLEHLRDAWNYVMAKEDEESRLENQDVLLTVPASFDAVARDLTAKAAEQAGFAGRGLCSRSRRPPSTHGYRRPERVGVSSSASAIVCSSAMWGGGTTDFSLIAVQDREGQVELERHCGGRSHPAWR